MSCLLFQREFGKILSADLLSSSSSSPPPASPAKGFQCPQPQRQGTGETDYETVISPAPSPASATASKPASTPPSSTSPPPTGNTVKWKFYEHHAHGIVLFAGDGVYLPVTQRTYTIGNSAYLAAAKTFHHTRIAVGV